MNRGNYRAIAFFTVVAAVPSILVAAGLAAYWLDPDELLVLVGIAVAVLQAYLANLRIIVHDLFRGHAPVS